MRKLLDLVRKLLGQSSSEKGFTLIELLVVIAIIGVLMVGTLVALNPTGQINKSKDANAKQRMDQLSTAINSYYLSNSSKYPKDKATLTSTNELSAWPKGPDNTTDISYIVAPNACDNSTTTCTSAAAYFTLLYADGSNAVWCWQSSTGKAQSVLNVAACTAP